ncbi:hypothetical protein RRG08_006522 [Elysia crispata]|uniref:Uncharacterized protein n=1 Tax=Elysia crispata TaxID=231223 RepID=A0AAE1CVZ9_9GAST|nr:hypothetical protein RRG08_006522 [Elysia crispata]
MNHADKGLPRSAAKTRGKNSPGEKSRYSCVKPQHHYEADPQVIPEPPQPEYWQLRPQPVLQPHRETEASRPVEPQPSTSQGEIGLNIAFHPPRTKSK